MLLNLARLYEVEHPDKALQCLLQVEQLELEQAAAAEPAPAAGDDDAAAKEQEQEDEAELRARLRKSLPPQLLNNIGCFCSQAEKHDLASEMFEAALGACVKIGEKKEQQEVFLFRKYLILCVNSLQVTV